MRSGPASKKISESFGVLAAQGHHQPMQVDRFVAVDQLMKAARDVQQHRFYGNAVRQFENSVGNCSSHLAITAAENSVSLSLKWL